MRSKGRRNLKYRTVVFGNSNHTHDIMTYKYKHIFFRQIWIISSGYISSHLRSSMHTHKLFQLIFIHQCTKINSPRGRITAGYFSLTIYLMYQRKKSPKVFFIDNIMKSELFISEVF